MRMNDGILQSSPPSDSVKRAAHSRWPAAPGWQTRGSHRRVWGDGAGTPLTRTSDVSLTSSPGGGCGPARAAAWSQPGWPAARCEAGLWTRGTRRRGHSERGLVTPAHTKTRHLPHWCRPCSVKWHLYFRIVSNNIQGLLREDRGSNQVKLFSALTLNQLLKVTTCLVSLSSLNSPWF